MAESDVPNVEPSSEGNKAAESSVGGGSAASKNEPPRRQGLTNFWLALKHVNDASLADNVKQRFSDYVTIALVVVCIVALIVAVVFPVPPSIKLLPLLFTVGAVIFYIVNRLGIMVSLTARQALIVWQILVAGFWLGVTSAMLVMLACFYFVSQSSSNGF